MGPMDADIAAAETFGKRLVSARKSRGFTQVQLASKTGVSLRSIANYELGLSEPGIEIVKKLCEGLGISADVLVGVHPTTIATPADLPECA